MFVDTTAPLLQADRPTFHRYSARVIKEYGRRSEPRMSRDETLSAGTRACRALGQTNLSIPLRYTQAYSKHACGFASRHACVCSPTGMVCAYVCIYAVLHRNVDAARGDS
jgi:hypothetical protein